MRIDTRFAECPTDLRTLVVEFSERHRDVAVRMAKYAFATFGQTGTMADSIMAEEVYKAVRNIYLRRYDEDDTKQTPRQSVQGPDTR